MDSKVKTILVSPFRQFTCCISVDGKEQEQPQKKAPHKQPCMTAEELQRYQKSIELENKKRAAFHQQRNAERAVMRTHFRQKYQLSQVTPSINRQNFNLYLMYCLQRDKIVFLKSVIAGFSAVSNLKN
uniref:Uncharacterized protein n=1 Tax=Erpetoichthys calabaricus TaxID=27687 RepID=A0A8C4REL2_ERPCA